MARKSLQQSVDFIGDQWGEKVQQEFINRLDYRIQQLKQNPELAPVFEDSTIRKLVIHKSISLFYSNQPELIKLLLIWDSRQDPVHLYRQLTKSKN